MSRCFDKRVIGGIGLLVAVLLGSGNPAWAGKGAKKLSVLSENPYLGAIVIDTGTGQILFEDHSDAKGYPASVLKLMDLYIVLEKIKDGSLRLEDKVLVTAEASRIGGSQVFLKEKEVFSVDELLYAMMVQSANDAITAMAIHVAGSKDGFVELMNQKAKELKLKSTEFHSIHGLPPSTGQEPDTTTARDLARLCRLLILNHPEALRYTSTKEKGFRNDTFVMRNHNHLLGAIEGCDGLKTGYFSAAGFSMAVTAKRGEDRVIVVVLGSNDKKVRDAKAAELVARGFTELAKIKALTPPVPPQPAPGATPPATPK